MVAPLKVVTDAWENIATALGRAGRDKRLSAQVIVPPVNTDERSLENLFVADDIARTIAQVPANEMIREWIKIMTDADFDKQPSPSKRIEAPADGQDIPKAVMQKLDKLEAKQKVREALTWARVYGGAVIFLGADDGSFGNPELLAEPLNPDAIREFTFLHVYHRFQLHTPITDLESDPTDPNFGMPRFYRIQQSETATASAHEHVPIHHSRFVRFDGQLTPRRRWLDNSGWSDSVYSSILDLIRDFGQSWGGVFHLLQDFSQAVFQMRGLKDALASNNSDLIISRLQTMDFCRSMLRMIPLDAENESFQRVPTPMGGLPEIIDRMEMRIAAAARMPVTMLFGRSPAGMNSTGASDIELFYNTIASAQETDLRPQLQKIIKLIFLSADGPTRGREPDNWSFQFEPLWQLDRKEEAEIRKLNADTDDIYIANGVLDPAEVTFSRFGGDEYGTEIIIDSETRDEDGRVPQPDEPEPPPQIIMQAPPTEPPVE